MAGVKETVKQSLVGSSEEPKLSQQIKTNFFHHARKDESTGEFYLNEDDFINAVAPKHEDYVSHCQSFSLPPLWQNVSSRCL